MSCGTESSSDVFEEERGVRGRRSGCLEDVPVVVEISPGLVPREPQVFYFSAKMFEFMHEKGSVERITQEAARLATQRKGDILKRQEATSRTENLRDFVQDKGHAKPPGPELAQLRRRKNATKKNTDHVMGRSADQLKRRCVASDQSDVSQTAELSQLSQQPPECVSSQSNTSGKNKRILWAKYSVPSLNPAPRAQSDNAEKDHEKDHVKSAVAVLAKQLAIDFKCDGEDDYVPIDSAFRLPQTNYETHGHFLTSCIAFCTLKKTGNHFVRATVSKKNQAVIMRCKLSSDLTGRATQRKKTKEDEYHSQAAMMLEDLQARDNSLWQGKQRTTFTKRVHNCKCALRLHYVIAAQEWRATITCGYHTGHSKEKLPLPLHVPTTVVQILQGLRSSINASVQQQLQLCAENGMPVTPEFIRRINASAASDPSFGLSGDAGFLFALITSADKLSFAVEFELLDVARKVVQRVSVGQVLGEYIHIQGGRTSLEPTMDYDGLDARESDGQLLEFYAFLRPYLIRQHGLKVKLRNCCWRTDQDLRMLSAHPNVVMFDTTCKTNVKNKHFGYGSGRTNNHNWFKGWSFFLDSLQKRDFWWLWNIALPVLIDQSVRHKVLVVVTDGDSNMIDAITGATNACDSNGQLVWGMQQHGGVRMRRCIFHLLHLNFESEYKMFATDGGVGVKVRDWLKHAGQRAETKEALIHAIEKIVQWIQSHGDDRLFTSVARELLKDWVVSRSMHTDDWARYNFNHLTCFDIETTSPSEGAHAGLKMDNQVSGVI